MILSARKHFPNWIKKAGYDTDAAIVASRLAAVDKLIGTDDWAFWLDISKLYLGIRVAGTHINQFVAAFAAEDEAFPLADNQNLLRHLAGVTLSIFVDESELEIASRFALSIVTTTFFGQYDLADLPPVVAYGKIRTQTEGVKARNNDLAESEILLKGLETNYVDEKVDDAAEFQNGEMNELLSIIRNNLITTKGLKEELNVHWWLFGEYMEAIDASFQEIDINRMLFYASHELAKQTVFRHPLRNSKQYLRKALEAAQTASRIDTTNAFTLVQNTTGDDREYLLDDIFDKVSYQTPILLAIKSASDVPGDEWLVHFKATSNLADANKVISINDLAEQLYREFLLIRYA